MQQRRKAAAIQPKVRLPADLHKKLWRAAKKADRTLNAEIVLRLTTSFDMEALEARFEEMDKGRTRAAELHAETMKMLHQIQELQRSGRGGLLFVNEEDRG